MRKRLSSEDYLGVPGRGPGSANTLVLGARERERATVAGTRRAWEGDVSGVGTQEPWEKI